MPSEFSTHLSRQATVFSLHINAQITPALGITLTGKFGMHKDHSQRTQNNHHPQYFAVHQVRNICIEENLNPLDDRGTVQRYSIIAARMDSASTK
jgi:hypothetical protein